VARRPEAVALCQELGLAPELEAPGTRSAYVWVGGRLRPLPPGAALGLPTRLGPLARSGVLGPAGLARAAVDLVLPARRGDTAPDVAVGDVVRRRFGRQVAERLAEPMIGGIHAGTIEQMSAAAVFPPLVAAARNRSGVMRALRDQAPPPDPAAPAFLRPPHGVATLVDRLVAALADGGAELRPAVGAVAVERRPGGRFTVHGSDGSLVEAEGIVVATPAPSATHVLGPHHAALHEVLGSLTHASVTLVTMRFAADALPPLPPGTGFLVPRGNALLTACTWLSAKWPALARPDDVLVRVSAGRAGDDRARLMDDASLVERALGELSPAMGLRAGPLEVMVARYDEAFPQYTVGHLERMAVAERAAAELGPVALAGAALRGVGIPACIASGRRAAAMVLERLGASAR
jgi:oxygen-dependent protoporphyrinogen oxidase